MKKSFSLMEVIISVVMLSVVMITLLQIKSDNIFIVEKSKDKSLSLDYIQLALNLEEKENINENRFLEKKYNFKNDEIREELKDIKIKVQSEKLDTKSYDSSNTNINIITNTITYSIDDITKSIYTFEIEL